MQKQQQINFEYDKDLEITKCLKAIAQIRKQFEQMISTKKKIQSLTSHLSQIRKYLRLTENNTS